MSYTLNQMEQYSRASARLWEITFKTRTFLCLAEGEPLTREGALNLIRTHLSSPSMATRQYGHELLCGASIEDAELYLRIELQIIVIRTLEEDVRYGRKTMEDVRVARSDFKSYLKLVPW